MGWHARRSGERRHCCEEGIYLACHRRDLHRASQDDALGGHFHRLALGGIFHYRRLSAGWLPCRSVHLCMREDGAIGVQDTLNLIGGA